MSDNKQSAVHVPRHTTGGQAGIAPRLLDVLTSPWAIVPEKLLEIQAVYFTHLRGDKIDITGMETKFSDAFPALQEKTYDIIDTVAIIPVQGIIAKKMNLFTKISGGVSTQLLKRDIMSALADQDVTSILLDVDSPGGTVDGTEELADAIAAARSVKPIVAYTDGLMASAAYWIAAAADMIYVSGETPVVGSIGVVTAHVDYSGYEEKLGVKTTEIYAGKYKRIASEYNPLSAEGRQYLQSQVDYLYSIFVNKVQTSRPNLVVPEEGSIPWADGRIFTGVQAVFAGLVDGVETKDRVIATMSDGSINTMIGRKRVRVKVDQQKLHMKGGNNHARIDS